MNIKPLVFKGYAFFENHRHKYKISILEAGCRIKGFGWQGGADGWQYVLDGRGANHMVIGSES